MRRPLPVDWQASLSTRAFDLSTFASLSSIEQEVALEGSLQFATARSLKPDERIFVFQAAVEAAALSNASDKLKARLVFSLAEALREGGDAESAEAHYRHLLSAGWSASTPKIQHDASLQLGLLLSDGNPNAAIIHLQAAAEIATRLGTSSVRWNDLKLVGSLLRSLSRPEDAADQYVAIIDEIETVSRDSTGATERLILAGLHANLGNVLDDDLGRHGEAVPHFDRASELYARMGDSESAMRRRVYAATACLNAGQYEQASHRILADKLLTDAHPADIRILLQNQAWKDCPEQSLSTFLAQTSDLARGPSLLLSGAMDVLRLVHAIRRRDYTYVGQWLLGSTCNGAVPRGGLSVWAFQAILEESGHELPTGQLWKIDWLRDAFTPAGKSSLHDRYQVELATISLLRFASEHRQNADSVSEEKFLEAPPVGLSRVSHQLPRWTTLVGHGSRKAVTSILGKVPSASELIAEIETETPRSVTVDGEPDPSKLDRSFELIRKADLLGDIHAQISFRRDYISALWASSPASPGLLRQCNELIDDAAAMSMGLPREIGRIECLRCLILKEGGWMDPDSLLPRAVTSGRVATELSGAEGSTFEAFAACVAYANAVVERPHSTIRDISSVISALTVATAQCDELSDFHRATMCNSLGIAHSRLWELTQETTHLLVAKKYLEEAVRTRSALGDVNRASRSWSNLLGTLVRLNLHHLLSDVDLIEATQEADFTFQTATDTAARMQSLVVSSMALSSANIAQSVTLAERGLAAAEATGDPRAVSWAGAELGRGFLASGETRRALHVLEETSRRVVAARSAASELHDLYDDDLRRLASLRVAAENALGSPALRLWAIAEGANSASGGWLLDDDRADMKGLLTILATYLSEGDSILQIATSAEVGYDLFVLRSIDGRLHADYIPGRAICLESKQWRHLNAWESVPIGNSELFGEVLELASRLVLAPVMDSQNLVFSKRLAIIAPDRLAHFPWELVRTPSDSEARGLFGDDFEIVYAPNCSVLGQLLSIRGVVPMDNFVFVGCDPIGNLKAPVAESMGAFQSVAPSGGRLLLDANSPVLRVEVLRALAEADYVHFAGHHLRNPEDPEEGGLLVSDGIIAPGDLRRSLASRAPQVVFLAACDTIVGVGNGGRGHAASMPNALLSAGVRAVIGARWPIPDQVAAFMVDVFYAKLFEVGPGEALQIARRRAWDLGAGYFAASFQMVGIAPRMVRESAPREVGAPRRSFWARLVDGSRRATRTDT